MQVFLQFCCMKLKLQYDSFETGEFTKEQEVDLHTLLTVFEENATIVKSYTRNRITINRPGVCLYLQDGQNFLRVQHFTKDAFTVDYCNDPDDRLYSGNFYKKSVKAILTLFAQQQHSQLCKQIPRTQRSESHTIKLFKEDDFVYHYKNQYLFSYLFNLFAEIFLFIFFFAMLVFSIVEYDRMGAFILFPLILTLLLLALIISVLILQKNYLENSKNKSIKVSSGSPEIVITENGKRITFNKSDIREVLFCGNFSIRRRLSLNNFSHIKIILKDKRVLNVTNMLIEGELLLHKLKNVPNKKVYQFYPYIHG